MRLPRLRFTVRRLMLVVALAAVTIWGAMWQVSRHYSDRYWRIIATSSFRDLDDHRTAGRYLLRAQEEDAETASWLRELAKQVNSRADMHAARARKYQLASRYPWLPVEPDPPLPRPWYRGPKWR
jgi:hypothetical protein